MSPRIIKSSLLLRLGATTVAVALGWAATLTSSAVAAEHRDISGSSANTSLAASGIRSEGAPIQNLGEGARPSATATPSGVMGTLPVVAGGLLAGQPWINNDDQAAEAAWVAQTSTPSGRATVLAANPISFHTGGSVYAGNVAIYPVWVGTWTSTRQTLWNKVLSNLVTALGTSTSNTGAANQVFATNLGYFTATNNVAPTLSWPQAAAPTSAIAASGNITDAQVAGFISTALSTGKVPTPTTSGGLRPIYVYIGANNTYLSSGFGKSYCGWHSYGTVGTTQVPYIAIQDFTSTYLSACASQSKYSPNGDVYVDAMTSILVHEIDESLTDPLLNAWYDAKGAENADKCSWTFGTKTLLNNYYYNYTSGGLKYLIQRNWLSNNIAKTDGTACALNTAS